VIGILTGLGKAGLARLGAGRYPLAVSWEVTRRCTRRCEYCDSWRGEQAELATDESLAVVDDLVSSGTRFLSLTGGEPLLRGDLPLIVDRAAAGGIRVGVSTNGDLLPERLTELSRLDHVVLSLDGGPDVQDRLRGKGAYRATIRAAEAALAADVSVEFTAVLSTESLDCVEEVLDVARRLGVRVTFQPAYARLLRSRSRNPLAPGGTRYRALMAQLAERKRGGEAAIANSVSALEYLAGFPGPEPIACAGGRLFLRILSDGRVEICGIGRDRPLVGVDIRDGLRRAMARLRPPRCDACWCARRTEVNLAWCGRLDALRRGYGRSEGRL